MQTVYICQNTFTFITLNLKLAITTQQICSGGTGENSAQFWELLRKRKGTVNIA